MISLCHTTAHIHLPYPSTQGTEVRQGCARGKLKGSLVIGLWRLIKVGRETEVESCDIHYMKLLNQSNWTMFTHNLLNRILFLLCFSHSIHTLYSVFQCFKKLSNQ